MARAAAASRRGRAGQPRRAGNSARSRSTGSARAAGARAPLVKDEGRLPTGSFKARGLAMAVTMAKHFGVDAHGAADQRQCRRRAGRLWRARRGSRPCDLPGRNAARSTYEETAALWRRGDRRRRPDRRMRRDLVGKGAAAGRWFDCSTLKEPYRLEGKKVMGLELAEQFGWELPDVDFLPDRRRHRADRHVEGLRRAGSRRTDRRQAAAHDRRPGGRLRADRARV